MILLSSNAPARSGARALRALAVAASLAAVAGCAQHSTVRATERSRVLRDQRITRAQLEELSNAFADRYFTLMLAASERVMRGNNDMQQCRIMNGLRLLGVSSMYDIATSPDTLGQLVDQMVVVTLQNYFWVDSGRSQVIWGARAQPLVENLRKAREDVWSMGSKVFTDEQLEQIDLMISSWWSQRGGTEFVAYVRFSEVASSKGQALIETVRDGNGLLEPIERATEQAQEAQLALERSFFWAKRVPLFANWQVQALMYDMLALQDTARIIQAVETISKTAATMPDRVNLVTERVASVQVTATDLADRVFRGAMVFLVTALVGGGVLIHLLRRPMR
jgi:hypothetical protein